MVNELMTAEEAAQHLGITLNNLRQIQFRGNLKWTVRQGRKVYYQREHVEAYAAKRRARKSAAMETTSVS